MSIRRTAAIIIMILTCVTMQARKKPIVGITCGGNEAVSTMENSYVRAVLAAGGIPVLLPCTSDPSAVREIVKSLDAIIFTGGEDVNPARYGEAPLPQLGTVNDLRDASDFEYASAVLGTRIPVMAICRGSQLINVACGGTLYQDLPSQKGVVHTQAPPVSEPMHEATLETDSVLYGLMKATTVEVNSTHHQAVKKIGNGLRVTAMSKDGIVESYQNTGKGQIIIGIQFHPEEMIKSHEEWNEVFRWFIAKAR